MRLLWLCNLIPGAIQQAVSGAAGNGLWIDHTLKDLLDRPETTLQVLCRGPKAAEGTVDDHLSYRVFAEPVMHRYELSLEPLFRQELRRFRPDIVHIWGTEYSHTLAMLRVCREEGLLDRTIVGIQGLCGICGKHYGEGLPKAALHGFSLRDLLRLDNVPMQRRRYLQRGRMESAALSITKHVLGRTHWDEAACKMLAPQAQYHFCGETLRQSFYSGTWEYGSCRTHSIFASGPETPVKGFHYLLEALPLVLKQYPDACVAVPGPDIFRSTGRARLLEQTYHRYLRRYAAGHGLTDHVRFLGRLDAEQMKQAFLSANVFVLPSVMENSPNTLGEAMLLGLPCVAADVGGVSSMLHTPEEGLLYQSSAPYVLAQDICRVFAMEADAAKMGIAAQRRARLTHDPKQNLNTLLDIYRSLSQADEP